MRNHNVKCCSRREKMVKSIVSIDDSWLLGGKINHIEVWENHRKK